MTRPTLTIAIPTYKRAHYLNILLSQLRKEVDLWSDPDAIEIVVSDNASPDDTRDVVFRAIENGLAIRYFRNTQNIGSDLNIAQAFNKARGCYAIIMGDDDVLVDGMLARLMCKLQEASPGVVLLRAFGFDDDFRAESPGTGGYWVAYDSDDFLCSAGPQITLISACVVNKRILEPVDAKLFAGGNLVQVHLVLQALLKQRGALIYEGYAIACKRNNSGGYSYADVFVKNLGEILDSYKSRGFSSKAIDQFESALLKSHHPYCLWRQLSRDPGQIVYSKKVFDDRYSGRWEYFVFVKPILYFPKTIAWLWGAVFASLGRAIYGGDLRKGFYFALNRLRGLLCRR